MSGTCCPSWGCATVPRPSFTPTKADSRADAGRASGTPQVPVAGVGVILEYWPQVSAAACRPSGCLFHSVCRCEDATPSGLHRDRRGRRAVPRPGPGRSGRAGPVARHPAKENSLSSMLTAALTPPAGRGSDFAGLSQLIVGAGLMKRRPGYYLARIGLVAGLYVAGWVAFVAVGDSWYQLLVAVYLAVATAQLAFVAHDIAHRQVFRTRRASEIAGLVAGNLGIGMSYGWWMDKHNRHH